MRDCLVITGASGFIGRQIVPALEHAGYDLLLSGRDTGRLETLFPGRRICKISQLSIQAKGCRALIHLAVRNNNQTGSDDAFVEANVTFLKQALENVRAAGVEMVIYPASLQAEPNAGTGYGRSKFAAEQMLTAHPNFQAVHLLRLPAVYGDQFQGRLAVLNKVPGLLRPMARQMLGCLKPMVHVSAVAQAMQDAVQTSASSARLVTDDMEQNLVYRVLKRTLDLGFALFVLIALWWVLLGAWLAVRLGSSGAGIFAQERVGQHQRPFTCYKFRTMQTGTKQAGTHEVSQASVTKVGHFLRRSKIDELPQIWNIFKGELSLVGPRPGLPVQHALIDARARLGVYAIRPGITGLGQVRGIDMSDPEKLAKLDGLYIQTRTLVLDLKITLATAIGKGLGDRTAS